MKISSGLLPEKQNRADLPTPALPLPPIEPLTVRIPMAVRLTGIGRSTLYELIKARHIQTVKVGKSTLVLVPSLRRFINSLRE